MTKKITYLACASFEAARRIDALPQQHRSHGLHGHSFMASVRCRLPAGFSVYPGGELDAVQAALAPPVGLLDYVLLNDAVTAPTDQNLARWVRDKCPLPGVQSVGIQSTANQGAEIDAFGRTDLWRRYFFHSAHQLPNVPAGHKCGNMHGHSFEAILHARLQSGESDLELTYDRLDACWEPIRQQLDHACLNELPGLTNPTSEVLSSWIWERIKPTLTHLSAVTVFETASCGANYDGTRYQIWKELTLDSALQFSRAPEKHLRRQLHGYTYTLRLHLCAPLDAVMGWTVDFGDVKDVFTPIFKMLDHQPLHQIPDLVDCDCASVASWILDKARAALPQLYRIDLFETRGCGVIVSDGGDGPHLPV